MRARMIFAAESLQQYERDKDTEKRRGAPRWVGEVVHKPAMLGSLEAPANQVRDAAAVDESPYF